jgi:hypothetical protein
MYPNHLQKRRVPMSFPLKKMLKVVETVVDVVQAAKTLTGAAGTMTGGSHDRNQTRSDSEHS